jgi:hypothetical protein
MVAIKTYTHGNKTLKIYQDENTDSPRTWDNLSKFICFHNRYDLGDKHNFKSDEYNSFAEMAKDIEAKEDTAIMLPLYMLDHSGITISLTDFNDRWDSGQIGFVIVTKEDIRKEYKVKRVTKKLIEDAKRIAENEVETYDQYLTGEIYGFKLFENDVETDSCWGFYGLDVKTNGMLDYINDKELVTYLSENLVVSI